MIDINLNLPIDTTPTDGSTNLIDSNAVFDGLATKQETLVSATNIKTINGTSVLGSGDLVVSGGNGVHALVINSGSPIHGQLTYAGLSSTPQVSNRMFLYPFIPANNFTSTNLFIAVQGSIVGALGKILIYSNVSGNPSMLLYESASLDCSTTGTKTATTSFSFNSGNTYWLAFWGNLNPSLYTMPSTSMLTFRNTGAVPSPFSGIAGTYIYGSAPSVITTTTIINSACPFIGMTPA